MAAAYGTPMVAGSDAYFGTPHQDLYRLVLLPNAVFILPRVTAPVMGGLAPVTPQYANTHFWNLASVVDMVGRFLSAAGAFSFPSLEEWSILPDKVKLQRMYEEYYAADPVNRTPPIPTVEVAVPGSPAELLQLCYSEDYMSSAAHLDAIMQALYIAMQALEAGLPQDSALRKVFVVDEAEPSLRHYVVKRQFSEGSTHVISFTFPGPALAATRSGPAPTSGSDAPWRLRQPPLSQGSSPAREELAGPFVARPLYLMEAAKIMAHEGCGECWLLQPKIAGMEALEYRVYLVGGAHAQGIAEDSLVVYTPAVLQDRGIAMVNLTIPEGYFWSDAVGLLGDSEPAGLADDPEKLARERRPWKSPELLIVAELV
ncbi:hypothetical protein WJX72_009445 [[Myrmecia] bisecta]|uniref:Uncharacterized protein n=1 Tax=[Myrmecia] bisecta TaxID=41462 RepID=A0AAW1Q141_9CHLO